MNWSRGRRGASMRRLARPGTALLVAVVSVVGGLAFAAREDGSNEVAAVGSSTNDTTCPDIPTAPTVVLNEQDEATEDAEALGCVAPPTTTTTLPGASTPSTTTSTVAPKLPAVPTAELTGSSGTVRVRVTVDPPELETAEVVTLRVAAEDTAGGRLKLGIDWGDVPGAAPSPSILECAGGEDEVLPPSNRTWTLRHSYRRPGRFAFALVVAAGYCDPDKGVTVKVPGIVAIAPGLLLSNGPLLPEVDAGKSEEGDQAVFNLGIDALERDGFIDKIEINWGDGSPGEVLSYGLDSCKDPLNAFPGPSQQLELVPHRYAVKGDYQATVRVHSAGCGGGDRQVRTVTVTATMP